MKALIDGDIVAYRNAAVAENENVGLAKWQCDEFIKRVLRDCNTTDFKIYLTGSDNFRELIYPEYKANRKNIPRPKFLEPLREHMIVEWGAEMVHGMEADDALGIAQYKLMSDDGFESIISTQDKDLNMICGPHYNFVTNEFFEVYYPDANLFFFTQLLTGDTTDNIKGCPKVGKVGAAKLLADRDYCNPQELYEICLGQYLSTYNNYKEALESIKLNGQLLWIWRKNPDLWQPPELEVVPL